jgi:hypothetical protein
VRIKTQPLIRPITAKDYIRPITQDKEQEIQDRQERREVRKQTRRVNKQRCQERIRVQRGEPVEQEAWEAWQEQEREKQPRGRQGQEQEQESCASQVRIRYTIQGRPVEYEEWRTWWEQEKQRLEESVGQSVGQSVVSSQ